MTRQLSSYLSSDLIHIIHDIPEWGLNDVLGMISELWANSVAEKYLQMLKDHGVRGYLFEQQNYIDKKK